jgi:hypothetical protein
MPGPAAGSSRPEIAPRNQLLQNFACSRDATRDRNTSARAFSPILHASKVRPARVLWDADPGRRRPGV